MSALKEGLGYMIGLRVHTQTCESLIAEAHSQSPPVDGDRHDNHKIMSIEAQMLSC